MSNLSIIGGMGIRVWPNITVSVFNVFRLPEIIDRLIDLGIVRKEKEKFKNFTLNIVKEPPCYHVSVLPRETREHIKRRLIHYLADFKAKYRVDISMHFLYLFRHLEMTGREAGLIDL